MRIISLSVEHFAGIRRAEIKPGPRLTILSGPNELGKSTLVDAIRAALLLQSSSSHCEKWIPWNSDETPCVKLVFQTEPERFYRVTKSFGQGSRSKSVLDESRDNVTYLNLASGRDVDGHLRRLLRWGIPEPGRGAPRGLPTSFLTAVLLPRQADATEIFRASLEDDRDDSGRDLLNEALESLAVDPLFTSAIEQAQNKVQQAFTPKGQRRRDRNSPFLQISDQIKKLEEDLQEAEKEKQKTETIQQQIRSLSEERTELEEKLQAMDAQLAQAVETLAERTRLEQERAGYRETLSHLQQQNEEIEKAEQEVHNLDQTASKARAHAAQLEKQLGDARQQLQEIRKEIQDARNDQSAARLDAEKERHARKLSEAQRELGKFESCKERAAYREAREQRRQQLSTQLEELQVELERYQTARDEARKQMEQLAVQRVLQQHAAVRKRIAGAESQLQQLDRQIEQSVQRSKQLEQLVEQRSRLQGATAEEIHSHSELQRQLELARAKLEVGLSAQLQLRQEAKIEIAIDGQAAQQFTSAEDSVLEAKSRLELRLPGLGTIQVRAGQREQQDKVESLEKQWQQQVVPLLQRCQCDTIEQLRERRERADQLDRRIAEIERELVGDRKLPEEREQEQAALEVAQRDAESLQHQLDELPSALIESMRQTLEYAAAGTSHFSGEQIKQQIESLQRTANRSGEQLAATKSELKHHQRDLARVEQELRSHVAEHGELAPVAEYDRKIADLTQLASQLDDELQELATNRSTNLQERESRAKTIEEQIVKLQEQKAAAVKKQQEAEREWNVAQGTAQTLQNSFQPEALSNARQQLEQVDRQLQQHAAWTIEQVEQLRADRDNVQSKLKSVCSLQLQKEGGLQQVEGQRAKERCRELEEALRERKAQEHLIIQDFEAWKLLLDTLVEVEKEEVGQLGDALAPKLALQLTELGQHQYSGIHMEGELKAAGVQINGAVRQLELLSQGMQDQFSTILRIHLAAQLGSFLILDDQLVHSDPQRMQWLCRLLDQSCERCQILVFTCRPQDYDLSQREDVVRLDLLKHLERMENG